MRRTLHRLTGFLACGFLLSIPTSPMAAQATTDDVIKHSSSDVAADQRALAARYRAHAAEHEADAALLPVAGTVPRPEPVRGLMDFLDRVAEYVEIRREVMAGIDGPAFCSDLEELSRQAHQRAAAIRDARPLAREGTVFTPRVAAFFRVRLVRAAHTAATDITPWVDAGDDVVLEVHTVLPWGVGTPASAGLVGVLPPLPEELEYRFVGRHLVLLDVELNLVVDVLREAVPAGIETPANTSLGTCDVHPELPECWM